MDKYLKKLVKACKELGADEIAVAVNNVAFVSLTSPSDKYVVEIDKNISHIKTDGVTVTLFNKEKLLGSEEKQVQD